ncbi:MAG: TRAP transporter large permease subunit [Rhodospirillaceae bacterium]|nr:TRAP transporter large permease subunit [Rhodospirillaceae bacterium]
MSGIEIGLISLVAMVALIFAGMYVPVVLALVSFVSVWAMRGDVDLAIKLLGLATENSLSSYLFGVVPLFVLMGLLVSVSEIGKDTFEIANWAFGGLKGGLGIATVAANAVFASITGISIASAAVFTKVAVPEMLRFGYTPKFAVGVVAGSSVLGMLIPPSLLMIVYGLLADVSIGDMFIAGIIPGTVLALAYAVGIIFMATRYPAQVGGTESVETAGHRPMTVMAFSAKISPIVILVIVVLGGIYGGVFTPTEAGAAGALGALVLAIAKRRLNWTTFWQVLVETGHVTASVLLLVLGATMYSRMLALSGLPSFLGTWMANAGLEFHWLIAIFVITVILMGTVLDSISIMLVLLPLIFPVLINMDVNLIWFGIVTIVAVEIGLLTPPFGLAVYIIKSTLDDARISLMDIFIGAFPFAVIMLLVLLLIIAVPSLSLLLL